MTSALHSDFLGKFDSERGSTFSAAGVGRGRGVGWVEGRERGKKRHGGPWGGGAALVHVPPPPDAAGVATGRTSFLHSWEGMRWAPPGLPCGRPASAEEEPPLEAVSHLLLQEPLPVLSPAAFQGEPPPCSATPKANSTRQDEEAAWGQRPLLSTQTLQRKWISKRPSVRLASQSCTTTRARSLARPSPNCITVAERVPFKW